MIATIDIACDVLEARRARNLVIVTSHHHRFITASEAGFMKSLAVRLMLAAVVVTACSAAAYFVWASESQARRGADDARAFDQTAIDLERAVLELRAAQQAYVAAGQGLNFWVTKVAESTATVKRRLESLRSLTTSSAAQSAIDNASSAVQDFEQMDRRTRDYVRNGQKLLASDLIFADGLEITGAMTASLDQVRTAEFAARDSDGRDHRRTEGVAIAGAAAVALVAILMLLPGPAAAVERVESEIPVAPRTLVMELPEPSQPLEAPATTMLSEPVTPPAAAPTIDLEKIASLCCDLAKVADTHALNALLGRAATVLDAPGIVVWIADPDGRELSPIVTHGYSQKTVVRLGTILREAQNATAAALRTSLLQTVDTDEISNGAIAAPLVTPAGCVGIMAAEVRHHGEKDPAKLAAASIIAAQLATLVGPPSTRAQARADAV
jgi:GAF domain